jgi:hypothetical protein
MTQAAQRVAWRGGAAAAMVEGGGQSRGQVLRRRGQTGHATKPRGGGAGRGELQLPGVGIRRSPTQHSAAGAVAGGNKAGASRGLTGSAITVREGVGRWQAGSERTQRKQEPAHVGHGLVPLRCASAICRIRAGPSESGPANRSSAEGVYCGPLRRRLGAAPFLARPRQGVQAQGAGAPVLKSGGAGRRGAGACHT